MPTTLIGHLSFYTTFLSEQTHALNNVSHYLSADTSHNTATLVQVLLNSRPRRASNCTSPTVSHALPPPDRTLTRITTHSPPLKATHSVATHLVSPPAPIPIPSVYTFYQFYFFLILSSYLVQTLTMFYPISVTSKLVSLLSYLHS